EAAEFDLAVFAQNRPPGELAPYVAAPYDDRPSLIGQAPVTSVTGEPAVDALNWVVITHQDRSEALVPVAAQRRAGLLLILAIIGVMAVVAVGVGQLLANPLIRLTDVAEKISGGNLRAQADVTTADETGKLATAFNAMTRRLRQTIDTLEETVAGRTQQLETVVDIGRQLTGILDLNELLQQLVTQIKETFNYYHIHIYLLDRQSETLTVAEGYGEAGAAMKRRGHSISLAAPRSLVARAAREGRIITVEDVRQDPFWLPNPLLPDTRSEMAVPVMLGPEVVGVLDVQSAELAGLTQQDETALQALALQIATAVHNARLFTRTQNALEEAERLRQLYTGQAWEQFGGALPTTDYEFRQPALPPLQAVPTPEAEAARKQAQTVDLRLPASGANGDTAAGDPDSQQTASPDTPHSALATPLKLGNQVIGVLGIHHADPDRRWTEDEIALLETVSEQMSLALDNARLFEETGRRAAREKVIADLTSRVWASGELEDVMQTAVSQLGTILDASKVVIRLGTEDQLQAGES
ncbi:MAG: GAF domain-containing protein, partial [Anaerolineae bacterium]